MSGRVTGLPGSLRPKKRWSCSFIGTVLRCAIVKGLCTNGTLACDSVRTPFTLTDGSGLFGQSQTSKQSKCDCCGVREAQNDVHHVGASAWADQCSDTPMQAGGTDFTTSSKFPQGQRRMFAVCTTQILERLKAPEERVTSDRSPSPDVCGGVECSSFDSSRY